MTFQEYQVAACKTAVYPNQGSNYIYPTLGLVGEAGEVAEKIKKVIRDEQQIMTSEKVQELSKELGDVLWYIAQLSTELGLDLEDVASGNIQKLQSRIERGVTHGSGDNR